MNKGKPFRVGIDVQTTLGQKTGFGFYVENLTKSLKNLTSGEEFALLSPKREHDLSTPQRLIWDQIGLPFQAAKARVNLLHQPAFSAPILYTGKKIVTVHDVISLFYTDIPFFSRQYYSKWMPFSYHFADHFITISEHSKKDIIQKLNIPAEKITVTYLAADPMFNQPVSSDESQKVLKKYNIEKPYLLDVGTINPRKNLEFLVNVFAEFKKTAKTDHHLVITGKKGWHYDVLFAKVKKLGLENEVIFTGYIEDDEKPAIYQNAAVFMFPSLYEGFGLPPVEAMMSGTPVISSNASSLPEVIGDGGIQLSPRDEKAWVEALHNVISRPELKQELIAKGKKQADMFSWDRCAKETLATYHQVLGG